MQWSKCPGAFLCGGTTPCNAGFNGQIASWEDRKDGKSGLLIVGGLGVPGQAVRVSYDSCETWENLTSGSSFTWQYGMPGPAVAARGDTVVVWASAGPDLELKNEHSGKPDQFGSFFASVDAGRTWSDVSPADPSSSVCHAMASDSNLLLSSSEAQVVCVCVCVCARICISLCVRGTVLAGWKAPWSTRCGKPIRCAC